MAKLKQLEIPPDIDRYGDCKMRCGDKTILEFFVQRVAAGVSPRMAESLAMQQAPGIGITDTNFISDQNRHGRSILDRMNGNKIMTELLRRNLKKHGYTLKSDDHYIPTVARFPGDPEAIVSNTNTLGDMKRRLQSRGVKTAGMFEMEADNSRPPAKQKHRLNPKIVNELDRKNIQQNPDLVTVPKKQRHAEIIERHGAAPQKD